MRLVREYKGPTVRDVLLAKESDLARLPARVAALERAVQRGDYAAADAAADGALDGLVQAVRVPRHRPRWLLTIGLVAWIAITVLLIALAR